MSFSARDRPNSVAVTAPSSDSSDRIATTAFVHAAISSAVPVTVLSSWTPGVAGAVTPGTVTYGPVEGWCTKIANLVFVAFEVQVTASSGATGDLLITGLPFPINSLFNNATAGGVITFVSSGWTAPTGYTWLNVGPTNSTAQTLTMVRNGPGVPEAHVQASEFSSVFELKGAVTYPASF